MHHGRLPPRRKEADRVINIDTVSGAHRPIAPEATAADEWIVKTALVLIAEQRDHHMRGMRAWNNWSNPYLTEIMAAQAAFWAIPDDPFDPSAWLTPELQFSTNPWCRWVVAAPPLRWTPEPWHNGNGDE